MVKSTALVLAVILLPGAALCSQDSDQQADMAIAQGAAVAARPAIESMHGMVATIDQGNDTIAIRLAPNRTEQFRVQDGLLFDSVRYGDQVEVAVQNIAGAKTIVELKKD